MHPMKIDDEIALLAQLGVESYNSLINSMATDTDEKLNCTPKFAIPGTCAFMLFNIFSSSAGDFLTKF